MFEQPVITIFCAFTRPWAVERWLDDLDHVRHDPKKTNLAIIVDADEPEIIEKFKRFVAARGYRGFLYKLNDDNFPNEVKLMVRRLRIADVKQQSKYLIQKLDGEYIIGLEDDTVFPNMSLERLLRPLIETDQVGFVQGVQCGRHGAKIIGAWVVDNPNDPQEIYSLPYVPGTVLPVGLPDYPYQEISTGGFYGYATHRHLYLKHDYYASPSQPMGPDVNFGLWVRRQGYKCLIDWSQVYGHNDHGRMLYPDTPGKPLVVLSWRKNSDTGLWERSDAEAN